MIRTPLRRAASAAIALALAAACASEPAPAPGGAAEYTSARYGYTIRYPDTLDLREYTPEHLALGRAAGDAFEAAVELSLEAGDAPDFRSFADERALQSCAADGPDLSLQCTAVQARQPVRTEGGLAGSAFYLRHVATRPATDEVVEVGGRGPYFVFDLSERAPGGGVAALFVRPPVALAPERADAELVRSVAASLRLVPAAPHR